MCGITALSRSDTTSIPNGRRFAIAAAVAIEDRGRHATGFGWADDEGWPWYWKSPGAASTVAKHADLPRDRRLSTLVGHTRHATQGSPSLADNNHPVVADGLVLVHNGRVDNDDDLIDVSGHERVGQVDSFALAAILTADLGADHPTELLELVEGVAAVAWIDGHEPGALHLARLAVRPLTIGRTRRGDLVASSTPETMRRTSRLGGVDISGIEVVPEGTYLRVEAGEVVERRSFAVRRPVLSMPEDVPTITRRHPPHRPLVKAAGGQQSRPSSPSEIDWENLVPRRGWSSNGQATHRWSTEFQCWVPR